MVLLTGIEAQRVTHRATTWVRWATLYYLSYLINSGYAIMLPL